MGNTESEKSNQTTFSSFLVFIGISPTIFSILPIPIGELTEGIIIVSIYSIGGVISWWHWRRFRASIGWLLFALAMSVLIIIGVKNNPLSIVAFFGSILVGAGLIISEGLAEVESRNRSTN